MYHITKVIEEYQFLERARRLFGEKGKDVFIEQLRALAQATLNTLYDPRAERNMAWEEENIQLVAMRIMLWQLGEIVGEETPEAALCRSVAADENRNAALEAPF